MPEQSDRVSATCTPLPQACEYSVPEQSAHVSATCTPWPQACEYSLPEQSALERAMPYVSRESDHPKQSAFSDAFDALESVLETPVKAKYRHRLDEGLQPGRQSDIPNLEKAAHCCVKKSFTK